MRLASLLDVPDLVELMEEFYAEASFPLDRDWAARSFSRLITEPAHGAVWLIDVNRAVAGHVVLSLRFTMEYGGLSAYIDDLFVRPAYRRQGGATAALDALIAECRRRACRSLHVEVDPENTAAITLYGRYGLVPGGDQRQQLSMAFPSSVDGPTADERHGY